MFCVQTSMEKKTYSLTHQKISKFYIYFCLTLDAMSDHSGQSQANKGTIDHFPELVQSNINQPAY